MSLSLSGRINDISFIEICHAVYDTTSQRNIRVHTRIQGGFLRWDSKSLNRSTYK